MEEKINALRNKIYEYYESMLLGEKTNSPKMDPDYFLPFKSIREGEEFYADLKNKVFCANREDLIFDDREYTTYVLGDVLERRKTENVENIVISTNTNGIVALEEYSGKDIKPAFTLPYYKGLVINLDTLEKKPSSPLLKGKSVQDVIDINFFYYDLLKSKSRELGHKYYSYYEKKRSEEPLLF